MILTKEEVMKRYLRGDYNTLEGIGFDKSEESIYWGMRGRGWQKWEKDWYGNTIPPTIMKVLRDEHILYSPRYEGSSEWFADLHDVLKTLGYL